MGMSNAQRALVEARKENHFIRTRGGIPVKSIEEAAKDLHKILMELDKVENGKESF
jgi:hypothetical protein